MAQKKSRSTFEKLKREQAVKERRAKKQERKQAARLAKIDEARVRDFARSYTEAWCSHDPTKVAAHYVPGGTVAVNGGAPTEVTEVARSFMAAFPDIQVVMDDVVFNEETIEYHWTLTGTNTGPGGTGKQVRISGFEEWTVGSDGLIVKSQGHYDQAEYDRQVEHGAPDAT